MTLLQTWQAVTCLILILSSYNTKCSNCFIHEILLLLHLLVHLLKNYYCKTTNSHNIFFFKKNIVSPIGILNNADKTSPLYYLVNPTRISMWKLSNLLHKEVIHSQASFQCILSKSSVMILAARAIIQCSASVC